jgi:hypothetical protein
MNPHNLNHHPNLDFSVSLTTPVKPRRSQSQSVAVINLEMSTLTRVPLPVKVSQTEATGQTRACRAVAATAKAGQTQSN